MLNAINQWHKINSKMNLNLFMYPRGIPSHNLVASSGFLVVIPLSLETQNTKVSSINVHCTLYKFYKYIKMIL